MPAAAPEQRPRLARLSGRLKPAPGWRWADLSGRLLWGGVMLLVLGAVLWLQDSAREQDSAPAPADSQRPDYRLEHFSWDHYGQDGSAVWRLAGASLEHFPDGRSRVRQARLTQRPESGGGGAGQGADPTAFEARPGLLTLSAGEAEASGSAPRQLQFSGGAELVWQDAYGQTRLRVRTGAMLWSEATQRVTSREPVQVSAQGQLWTAAGFDYDIRRRTLSFKGAVRGVLSASPRSSTGPS